MPTCLATDSAVARASPVTSQTSIFAAASSRTAAWASTLTGSLIASNPAATPSTATIAVVRPALAAASIASASGARSIPPPSSSRRLPTRTMRGPAVESTVPRTPPPMTASKSVTRPNPSLVLVRSGDDRRSERVLARALDGAGEIEQVVGRESGSDDDLGDGRTPEGQRARLVEHDGVHAMGDLERLTAADEDPRLRPASRPDHDGGRGGEAHRARTRDDDDADEGRQRQRDPWLRPERQPHEERARGDDEDDRDEDLGDPIGQSLDGRLAALGPTHEVHDPGERGVASDPRRPHHERAGRVEGRSDDLGARGHLDRHGLAGQHAGVDRGATLDDDAVDGHPLPGPDAQQVTDRDRLERHVLFAPVGHAPGRLGRETRRAAGSPRSCWSWRDARATDRAGRARR